MYLCTEGSDTVAPELSEGENHCLGGRGVLPHTSELKTIPHLPAARECTHICYRVLLGGRVVLFKKKHLFLFDPLFLNMFNTVTGVCILFHFFPLTLNT